MTTTFEMVRNQVIVKACRQAGILEQGEQPDPEMLQSAADYLNIMIKDMEVYRKKLWSVEQVTQALTIPDTVTNNGTTYYCIKSHTSTAASEPGVGSLWEAYWYAGEVIDATASPWAIATSYTNSAEIDAAEATTTIETAFIRHNNTDYPLEVINRFTEAALPAKYWMGQPQQLRFDRPNQKIQLHPIPDQPYLLVYNRIRLLEDITTASGDIDIPQTLFSYLILELAAWMAEEYQQEEAKINRLQGKAQAKLALAIRNQHEYTDNKFVDPAY